ncbi:MAG: hypothetical protein HKM93_01970 [Desulfobacteraceae bacterium]|nr:hypothetical protein [Desulfobacteraceae bacterium]
MKLFHKLFKKSLQRERHTRLEVLGVHKIKSREPCHLIEILIHDNRNPVDLGEFTQLLEGKPESSWQAPYDDMFLDQEGKNVVGSVMVQGMSRPELWEGDVRIAFFFHYLQMDRPMATPFGKIILPEATPRPRRLRCIKYDAVD